MPRFHNINGKNVQLTPEEEVSRDNEEAAELAAKPMRDWQAQMQALDAGMPRYAEDIMGALATAIRDKVAKSTLDKYSAKKALRAAKPS